MIGYLKGDVAAVQKTSNNRVTLTLAVNNIGYDLQIVPRMVQQLPASGEKLQVHTHLQVRDDQLVLYGFASAAERDLFRQLVSVSGIGPQIAIALLDGLGLQELVRAIVSGNTRLLSQAPGVGKKTAERLALELKSKLAEWRQQAGIVAAPAAGPTSVIQEDVEMTLLALGYSSNEILQAVQAVGESTALPKNADAEGWIRETIAWLSR